jgi:DNA primase
MAYDYGEIALGFATLSKLVETKLAAEYETGRIKGTEYADVFNQLMQEILKLSFDSPLKDSQKELADAQVVDQQYVTQNIRPGELAKIECDTRLCESKISLTDSQKSLTDAQTADQEYVTANIRPHEAQLKEKELDLMAAKIDLEEAQVDLANKELLLKDKEIELAQQKILLMQKDVDYKDAQIRFTDRQIVGFDDNLKQKMLDTQMNAWGIMYSSGLLDQVPGIIAGCVVDGLYRNMAEGAGVPVTGNCSNTTTRDCKNADKKK